MKEKDGIVSSTSLPTCERDKAGETSLSSWEKTQRHRLLRSSLRFIILDAVIAIYFFAFGLAVWRSIVLFQNDHAMPVPLRFTSDGTFQISIFEDLHFGESTSPFHD